MNSRIIMAGGMALALASCSPFGTAGRSTSPATVQTGSISPASYSPDSSAAAASIETAALSPTEPVSGQGHVDAPGSAPHSHDGAKVYGEPGDPTQPARSIEITMSETDDGQMIFSPQKIQASAGEQVRFKIQNSGQLEHEFVLATHEENLKHGLEMQKNPDMEHDDPNAVRLQPGKTGEIVWKFTNSGDFEFACLIPGHRESGMYGTVVAMK
jgi:uncharacterized cupredoxin-like copper-binding protein